VIEGIVGGQFFGLGGGKKRMIAAKKSEGESVGDQSLIVSQRYGPIARRRRL
jgi:hypothetical protein